MGSVEKRSVEERSSSGLCWLSFRVRPGSGIRRVLGFRFRDLLPVSGTDEGRIGGFFWAGTEIPGHPRDSLAPPYLSPFLPRFTEVKEVPDLIKDARAWFQIVDADFGGTLSKNEVLQALAAVLPVEKEKLRIAIESHWHEWDPDGEGGISQTEFLQKETGLQHYIVSNLKELKAVAHEAENIPNLDTHPIEWFEYWDLDHSGTLELDEVIRAFIRTFCISSWGEPLFSRAFDMRTHATQLWTDMGFHVMDSIDFVTFIQPHGLADTFLHNEIHCRWFGEGGTGF